MQLMLFPNYQDYYHLLILAIPHNIHLVLHLFRRVQPFLQMHFALISMLSTSNAMLMEGLFIKLLHLHLPYLLDIRLLQIYCLLQLVIHLIVVLQMILLVNHQYLQQAQVLHQPIKQVVFLQLSLPQVFWVHNLQEGIHPSFICCWIFLQVYHHSQNSKVFLLLFNHP